jgi:2-methylisocitrate lyase-like PEP mutase family enzyme
MQNDCQKNFRRVLSENEFLTLPGIYDCISARIAEEAGFPALFLSGGALAYSRLGVPDFGFLNLTEFGDVIKNITACVKIPLVADADNGFGNAIQAAYTGKIYERLGAAGLQIDDKILPSANPNKNEIVPWELIAPKIRAVRQNVSDEFVIIYRTCANLYDYGIEESIRRVNLAKACGADYAYVDGLRSVGEMEMLSKEANLPLMINLNEKGFCGSLPIEQIKKLNYSIGLFPISAMLAGAKGMMNVLGVLSKEGSTLSARGEMVDPPTVIHNMMGQTSLVETYGKLYR